MSLTRRLFPALLLAFSLSWVPCRGAAGQTAADTLRRLDSAWARSYQVHDTVTARALFAPDIMITGGAGQTKDREGELADVRPSPGLVMKYFTTSKVAMRVHGSAGVVTGRAEWSFDHNGRTSTMRRSYTATYVRGGPLGWKMVALHLGPAPANGTALQQKSRD